MAREEARSSSATLFSMDRQRKKRAAARGEEE
jgi:hypothetical protein